MLRSLCFFAWPRNPERGGLDLEVPVEGARRVGQPHDARAAHAHRILRLVRHGRRPRHARAVLFHISCMINT